MPACSAIYLMAINTILSPYVQRSYLYKYTAFIRYTKTYLSSLGILADQLLT